MTLNVKIVHKVLSHPSFIISLKIILEKPHLINKRLWGCKRLNKLTCKTCQCEWEQLSVAPRLKSANNITTKDFHDLIKVLKLEPSNEINDDNVEIILTELLPKYYDGNHAYQLICLKWKDATVVFYDVTPLEMKHNLSPNFPYSLKLNNDDLVLTSKCDMDTKSYQWLENVMLPHFIKLGNPSQSQFCNGSLCLISSETYYTKYNELKHKYGKDMVKIWPECTDPTKFVYEDVAIATYLLLLWKDERQNRASKDLQTFVDLGCGNGLLVYILTMEGHCGVGFDVRKRRIWDLYPIQVKLEEKTITPSSCHLFSDADWIIGNHSDELTPWIPVIAAKSSYKCNFFLLPCCAYNFDGTKYQRHNSSVSQYTEYLLYIKQLCETCGFKTDMDRLKIPSTKRLCFVGRGRSYSESHHNNYLITVQSLTRQGLNPHNVIDENLWMPEFKARNPVEKVKNCTQIDSSLSIYIIDMITKYLLKETNQDSKWSTGKVAEMNELVKLIPHEKLKGLKSECGGLQTLLKNNHQIFKVQKAR